MTVTKARKGTADTTPLLLPATILTIADINVKKAPMRRFFVSKEAQLFLHLTVGLRRIQTGGVANEC
jgi:hypothetical protein